jgi:hypothetical protein
LKRNHLLQAEAGSQWLTPVTLATQEAEIRRMRFQSQPQGKDFSRPYLENTQHKTGLVK